MLIAIAIVLALIPAIAILYPFLMKKRIDREFLDDESSPQADLSRRWETSIAGLRNAELEWAIGNLAEEDYRWLRNRYITDAALIMKEMELEEAQEQELLSSIDLEIKKVRYRALGPNGVNPLVTCPNCSYGMEQMMDDCPNCGRPLVELHPEPPTQPVTGDSASD
jgi:hypothetical protein